ncbi:MAG: MogA/MoaB family molybdenum cofactor biosynthesis protein [Thermoplasmata archaeon]
MVHKTEPDRKFNILIAVVSTSRTLKSDVSGDALKEAFLARNHSVEKVICKDDEVEIRETFESNPDHDIFIFVGGTGPSRKDVTVQSLRKIADKEMVGFGELFRKESNEIFAYLSNSTLLIKDRKQVYCIPGSPDATSIAFSLINSIMGHIYHELNKE